jgi:hypothetical protein
MTNLAMQAAEQFVSEQLQEAYLKVHRQRILRLAGLTEESDK